MAWNITKLNRADSTCRFRRWFLSEMKTILSCSTLTNWTLELFEIMHTEIVYRWSIIVSPFYSASQTFSIVTFVKVSSTPFPVSRGKSI